MSGPLKLSNPPTGGYLVSEYKYLVYVLEEAKQRRDHGPPLASLHNFIDDCAHWVVASPCRHNINMSGIKNENPQTHPQVLLNKYKHMIEFNGTDFESSQTKLDVSRYHEEEYQKNLNKLTEMYQRKEKIESFNNPSADLNSAINEMEHVIEKQLEMKEKESKKKPAPKPKPKTTTTSKPSPSSPKKVPPPSS